MFYTGVTNSIERRMYEHKRGIGSAFVKKYNVVDLLYVEHCFDPGAAIEREKQIKAWGKRKKLQLIRSVNPELRDLSEDFE